MPDYVLTALRFTVNATPYAFATDTTLRAGDWHEPFIQRAVALSSPYTDELGIARQGGVEVQISDPAGTLLALEASNNLDGLVCDIELVHQYDDASGAGQELIHTEKMYVASYSMGRAEISLRLEDLEVKQLDQLWPPNTYSTELFANLLEAHAGLAIADPVDIVLKLPCALIDTTTDWVYSVCEKPAGGTPLVLTVYRDDRIVDPSEYTVGTLATGGTPASVVTVTFTREQLDFNGGYFEITADVDGYHDKNVVTEIERLITGVGLTYAAATLAAGQAWATTNKAFVACDYGRGGQRRVSAILRDLLFVARGELYRDSAGEYSVWHDQAASAIASYDEDAGDAVEVSRRDCPGRPQSVALAYRPSPQDPGRLQHTVTRNVTNGAQPPATAKAVRYVREHESADRLLDYRAKRAEYNRTVNCTIHRVQLSRGDVIALKSSGLIDTLSDYQVRGIRRVAGANELRLLQHSDAIHTYTPGTLPTDAVLGYQPDYSQTPPAKPTAVTISAEAVNLLEGAAVAQITVRATPPAVNAGAVWFMATNSTTGEISLQSGTEIAGGKFQATLSGLRPNTAHTLDVWVVNAYGVEGAVESTFRAVAIGGGAADTSFTSMAYGTTPPKPNLAIIIQGTGRQLSPWWSWSGDTAVLREFQVQRSENSGSYVTVWTGKGQSYTDDDVYYGKSYAYKVRALDKYNNPSSWSFVRSISAANFDGNVGSTDVMDGNIKTNHRDAISTLSTSYSIAAGRVDWHSTYIVVHGLGKIPLTTISSEDIDVLAYLTGVGTSGATIGVLRIPYFDTAGHAADKPAKSGTAKLSFW